MAKIADIASTAIGKGASMQGIADVGGHFTGTTTEAALQELGAGKIYSRSIKVNCIADTWVTVPGIGGRKGALLLMIGVEDQNNVGAAIFAFAKSGWAGTATKVSIVNVPDYNTANTFDAQWILGGELQIKHPNNINNVNVTLIFCG